MHDREKILPFATRTRHLAPTFKTMTVFVDDSEMEMTLFNELSFHSDSLIFALDAAHTDNISFNFEFEQSCCVQKEKRQTQPA